MKRTNEKTGINEMQSNVQNNNGSGWQQVVWKDLNEGYENLIVKNLPNIICIVVAIYFLLSSWCVVLMVRSGNVLAQHEEAIRGLQVQTQLNADRIRELKK